MVAKVGVEGESLAQEAIRSLLRAVQTLRTYPAGNEVSVRAMQDLEPKLGAAGTLHLELGSEGTLLEGAALDDSTTDRVGILAALFRDGVRRLEIRPGMDLAEMQRVVGALSRPIAADDLSEDYVTRLWEADAAHLGVAAVDPYLDVDSDEAVLEGKETPQIEEDAASNDAHQNLPPPPKEAFRVSEADRLRIAQEVKQLRETAPWGSFIDALFATLRSGVGLARAKEVVPLVEACFHRCLSTGRLPLAARVLDELHGAVPSAVVPLLRGAVGRMASPERLAPLHEALEAGSSPIDQARGILARLGPPALPALAALLPSTRSEAVRKLYAEQLVALGPAALPTLRDLLERTEPELRTTLVWMLGRIRSPDATAMLLSILSRADASLRREVVRSLARQGDASANARTLEMALGDSDPTCRVIALRGLAGAAGTVACDRLMARIRAVAFRGLPDEEKDLLFAALGRVGGDELLPFLKRELRPPTLWRRPSPARWKRAASALAGLGTARARALLEELASHRDERLASLCVEALRESRRRPR